MEKKRARTRAAILRSAKELFTSNGFEETSMEEIAALAEIATGTLYNYFGSKSVLLFAMYDDLAQELKQHAPVRKPGEINAETALLDICTVLRHYSKSASLFPKPIMRKVMAHLFELDAAQMAELVTVELQFMGLILPILQDMEEAGLLAAGVDVEGAAMLLYGAAAANQQAYITIEQMSERQMLDVIEMQVRTMFFGLLPREQIKRASK